MEKRNRQMHFRLTASEMERVEAKMKELGIKSLCAYLRKMAVFLLSASPREARFMALKAALLSRSDNSLLSYGEMSSLATRLFSFE